MSDLNIALVLRFIDQATAPARKAMEGIQGASEAVQRFGDQTVARGQAMRETAQAQTTAMRGQTLATVGMGYAFYKAMQPAIEFEAQMSKVGAIAKASEAEQRALAQVALEQGARTRFSASQAAEGLEKLAAAGLNVEQSIQGLPGVLDLAAASGVNLRDTADFVTNITSGFGLEVADMARVGDVLVNTFTSSNTTLESVAATMSYAAPAAKNLGVEIEQVAAMTGLLGDQAISGERAGTALRGIMARLSGPSTAATKALKQMNVQLADTDGNLRALPEIFADMNTAMADMGSATRGDLMNTIFGMEAANEAAILIDAAGTGALQRYTEQLRETGTASSVAARMSDNARGAMDRLKSVTEATQIAMGNGLLPVLVDLAERAMPVIAMAGEWLVANQELVTTIGYVVAGLLGLNIAVLAVKWGFWLLFGWIGSVLIAFGRFFQALGLLGRYAIPALKLALLAVGNPLIFLGRMAVLALWGLRWFGRAALLLIPALAKLAWPITLLVAGALLLRRYWDRLKAVFTGVGRAILGELQPAFEWLKDAFGNMRSWLRDGVGTIAERLGADAEAAKAAFDRMLDAVPDFNAIKDRITGGFEWVGSFFGNLFAREVLTDAEADAIANRAQALTERIIGYFGLLTFDNLRASAEAVFTYITGWTFDDVGQALRSAFDIDLYAVGVDLITRLGEGIWSVLTGLVARIRSELANIAPDWLVNGVNRLRGGGGGSANPAAGPGGVAGARALGGPVRPGFVYEINEQGREFFMPDVPGRVLPAHMFAGLAEGAMSLMENLPDIPGPFSDTRPSGRGSRLFSGIEARQAGAQVTYQGDTINLTIHASDAHDLERKLERFFERRERQRRYNLHDGGMHD